MFCDSKSYSPVQNDQQVESDHTIGTELLY